MRIFCIKAILKRVVIPFILFGLENAAKSLNRKLYHTCKVLLFPKVLMHISMYELRNYLSYKSSGNHPTKEFLMSEITKVYTVPNCLYFALILKLTELYLKLILAIILFHLDPEKAFDKSYKLSQIFFRN